MDASDEDGTVISVSVYEGEILIGTDDTAPYTIDWTGTTPGTHVLKAVATDNKGVKGTSQNLALIIEAIQAPFNGAPHRIPGRIEAEEFDFGGEDLAYHEANTNGNEGDANFRNDEVDIEICEDTEGEFNIGYTLQGEWLEYTVDVETTDLYNIDFRVACAENNRTISLSVDGNEFISDVAIPNTSGWQTWETVSVSDIELTKGEHIIRLTIGAEDYINLNYMEFKSATVTSTNLRSDLMVHSQPNPFTEHTILHFDGNFTYEVLNSLGKVLETGKARNTATIGATLLRGLYIVKISSLNGEKTLQIIKE